VPDVPYSRAAWLDFHFGPLPETLLRYALLTQPSVTYAVSSPDKKTLLQSIVNLKFLELGPAKRREFTVRGNRIVCGVAEALDNDGSFAAESVLGNIMVQTKVLEAQRSHCVNDAAQLIPWMLTEAARFPAGTSFSQVALKQLEAIKDPAFQDRLARQ